MQAAPLLSAPRPERTQGFWAQAATLAAVAGTVRFYMGIADERGLTLRRLHVINRDATLAVSTTAYHTFRPFISTVKDGVATVRYLGASRGTNTYALGKDLPLRVHDEEQFNERLPVGAVIGIDVVTTSTPTAKVVMLQASYFYSGG